MYTFHDAVKYGLCQKKALNSLNEVLANYGLSSAASLYDAPEQTILNALGLTRLQRVAVVGLQSVPVAVGGAARGEQKPRLDQRVRVDHPLDVRGRGVQLPGEGGDRHVQHGVVEQHGQLGETDDAEDQPALGVAVAITLYSGLDYFVRALRPSAVP